MTQLSINTTQNVQISFTAAPLTDRAMAYGVDVLIKIAYGVSVYYLFFVLIGFGRLLDTMDQWSGIALLLFFYFPVMIYTLTLESIFEGQTFGKKLLKIKVVKIDGYQASFADYLMRWFFRIVDITMSLGAAALCCIAISPKHQRVGDYAAGTAVISLKNKVSISNTILEELDEAYAPTYPLVIKLSDNDIRIIKETAIRAKKKKDHKMLSDLSTRVCEITGIKKNEGSDTDFLRTVLKDYNYYTQSM